MRTFGAIEAARSIATARSDFQSTEENYGNVLTDLARYLYPPPKTAAQIAAAIKCSERNIEFCLSGKQEWSGDAIAHFISEILRRHGMRNFKVVRRK